VIVFERAVRFEEVDAAGIVFFGRFQSYAHDALEHFFAGLEGGYAGIVVGRGIGFPVVHLDVDFQSPIRYGDVVFIETSLAKIGHRSAVFRHLMKKPDGTIVCDAKHTVVLTDLKAMKSCEMPADVRALMLAHLAAT
jgi:4-hydroxybenzoyl-CoA thioesterase